MRRLPGMRPPPGMAARMPVGGTSAAGRSGMSARARPGPTLDAMFLGEDLLAWLVLAIGGAMAAGSIMALVRPPEQPREGDLATAPVGRSLVMIVIGAIAALWALASLVSG